MKKAEINIESNYKYNFAHIDATKTDNVSNMFIDAIKNLTLQDAKKYVSKHLVNLVDYTALSDLVKESTNYKFTSKIDLNSKNKNCSTIIMSTSDKQNFILKIYLVYEPNKYSKWKIYAINKENII